MPSFGERLKHARTRAKLSQESLGDKAGVTKAAVSQWEAGISQGCKVDTLFALSDALVVNPRWLATGKGEADTTIEMPHHIRAARQLDSIPKAAREPLVRLIEELSKASEERFWQWAKESG